VRALALVSAMMGIAAHAQTFTTLVNFSGPNGAIPTYESLVQGIDGNFYGTTSLGTSQNLGTVFVMNPQGQLRTLHNFDGTDGANPQAGLPNGMLYGTTSYGGANGDYGTIFQITPNGTLTTLHSFSGTDGANPYAGLVQAFDGMLYGTTSRGGASGNGTIFQITPSGALTTLHSFSGTDGANAFAGLVQAANGMLYGTTTEGGAYNAGTIYAIGLSGAFTPLYSFDITDGLNPYGALVEGANGNFYGTTNRGGASVYGTVFRITATGTLTLLDSFDSTDGAQPSGGLVKGTHGDFYGTTADGGADFYGYGTVFQIAPTGTLTTLHSFDRAGGAAPLGGLVQGTDGNFYGTTNGGGAGEYGTVFRLSMGLGPLVKTLPAFGKVGAAVKILGTDLTGATSVTFNGTPAAFTILFPTAIQTTVPSGASTGTVQVVTPSGTIASNMLFQVL